MKKILSITLTLIIVLSLGCSAFAGTNEIDIDKTIQNIIDARVAKAGSDIDDAQELVSVTFSSSPATGEEWYIFALRNYSSEINYSKYKNALEDYLENNEIKNVVSKQRIGLVLIALEDQHDFLNNLVDETAGNLGLMSYVFALHLMNNGCESSKYSQASLASTLISKQLKDGGWAISGNTSDVDVTAMVIQALAPHYDDAKVKKSIDKAITLLSSMQLESGGFKSYGVENPESSAQVLMALASVGIDGLEDERFIKNGNGIADAIMTFALDDGTFKHTLDGNSNATATVQVLYSLVSYKMYKEGKASFYEFTKNDLKEPLNDSSDIKSIFGKWTINIKVVICVIIGLIAAGYIIISLIREEFSAKKTISAILVATILIILVSFINIESNSSHYNVETDSKNSIQTTISIRCDTVAGKKESIPADGIILNLEDVLVPANATAYDQLILASKQYKVQVESQSESYIEGIADIYEFDFGDLSGWMYRVNGKWADVGANEMILHAGDYVEWLYTTNLGKDIGNNYMGD